jgi:hypothetical protein
MHIYQYTHINWGDYDIILVEKHDKARNKAVD